MSLDHENGDCTGNWRLLGAGADRRIECDRCRRIHPATPENRLLAIDENYAGMYLGRLASEGASRLARD